MMQAKDGARERFAAAREALIALSRRIHAHPELGFEEEKASGWLCDALDEAGFAVERGLRFAHGLPRAGRVGAAAYWHLRGIRFAAGYWARVRAQHYRRVGGGRS